MPAHTLVKVIAQPIKGWDTGNIVQVCELEYRGPGDYWVRNHRADDGVPNDRTARRGWARWTEDEGHLEERKLGAFYPIRNMHPDEARHLVGPGVVNLDIASIHRGRGVELEFIMNRTQRSPISEGRLTRAALLAAPHGPNWGRDMNEILAEVADG